MRTNKTRSEKLTMKKKLWKKTSQLLAALMILSVLLPVLASAAMKFNGSLAGNGNLSGQIKFDGAIGEAVYGHSPITLGVYSRNGTHIKDIPVTLTVYENQTSTYKVDNLVISSVYDAVYFSYGGEVSELVYRESERVSSGGSSGNSGSSGSGGSTGGGNGNEGGGTGQPGDVTNVIDASDDGKVDADKLKAALAKYKEVTIRVKGETASIPASALVDAQHGSVLNIITKEGSYILPLGAIDLQELADTVQSDVADVNIHIGMKLLSGNAAESVTDAIERLGAKALSNAFDVQFAVEGKDGNKKPIHVFDQYVKRKIPLLQKPSKSAAIVLYNPDTQKLSFVPGSITDSEATFWRTGNSIYTVIELNKTFNDISSHWAKSDIELLASKLIVEGATDSSFEPNRNLTRAEFVALAVRAFGLVEINGVTYFSDIKTSDWYSGIIAAAAKAGIINGYEDDTFRPNDSITREELAAIIVRAYQYAGGEIAMDASKQSKLLAEWDDTEWIVWGETEVAKALSAGFMVGMSDTELETYRSATRAQTVTMLKRVLTKLDFID